MRVWPNRWVWLVWIRSGVRIQTRAALETSPSAISLSALIWSWPRCVIGMSGARLVSTSPGERPTAVAACTNAATAPQPMPTRKSVQKTFALRGRRAR